LIYLGFNNLLLCLFHTLRGNSKAFSNWEPLKTRTRRRKKNCVRAYQFWVGIVVVDVVARRERDDPYPAGALSLKATRHQLMENSDYY